MRYFGYLQGGSGYVLTHRTIKGIMCVGCVGVGLNHDSWNWIISSQGHVILRSVSSSLISLLLARPATKEKVLKNGVTYIFLAGNQMK